MNTKEPISDTDLAKQLFHLRNKTENEIACDFIKLKRILSDLDHKAHSHYDFNADPENITLAVGDALAL